MLFEKEKKHNEYFNFRYKIQLDLSVFQAQKDPNVHL